MQKQAARKLVQETLQGSFNKERFVYLVKNILNHVEEAPFTYKGNFIFDDFADSIRLVERVGKYQGPDEKLVDILIVHLAKNTTLDRARTKQRNFVAKYLKGSRGGVLKDAALVAFVAPNGEDWRFSLVKMEYKFNEKGKVQEEFTPARRYSFLVGKNENSHTAQSRLLPVLLNDDINPTLEELEETFSVERVTKEFFEKYRDLFLRIKESLDAVVKKDAKVRADFKEKNIDPVDFVKKLLGQVVFLYFLQKKGWFGVERGKEWGSGSKHFLRELFEGHQRGEYLPAPQADASRQAGKNFFNDILEPLFYEALRLERSGDYYSRFNCRIPFLNGGLFDPLGDYDWWNTDILLPDDIFSNGRKTKEGDIGDGVLDIFDRYNFTVKEDEPLEKEVAVDPEMLGKVFENLLEVKDRKSKGTYYTPREIVHYMCQESLANYLATELEGKTSKEDIETLIKYGEAVVEHDSRVTSEGRETDRYSFKLPQSVRKHAKLIDEKLAAIRVCDPAVGSGAFPVGMMNEIIRTRNALTPHINGDLSAEALAKAERTPYHFKRQAIQNCLYGVDIDPGAVEIAKLRLWLSLVVDEEERETIQPLPNLDYKIVQGNSLLSVEKNLFNAALFSKLEELKPLYFNETSASKKQEYSKQIDELISQITNLPAPGEARQAGGQQLFDFEVYFSEVFHEKKGFDVVIANPPYVRMESFKELKNTLKKEYKVFHPRADLYCYFLGLAYNISRPNGISTYISSNKYFRSGYGKPLRELLSQTATIKTIINFSGSRVFETAAVDTAIIIFQKLTSQDNEFLFVEVSRPIENDGFERFVQEQSVVFDQHELTENGWSFSAPELEIVIKKINKGGVPLKEHGINVVMGIKSGARNVFEINKAKRQTFLKDPGVDKVIKPIVHGKDIRRWRFTQPKNYLLFIKRGTDIKKYPKIYKHLEANKKILEKRATVGTHPWYELQQPQMGIYEEFEKERIIYPDISEKPRFALSPAGTYCDNTTYNLTTNSKYILAVLNSRLIEVFYKSIANALGNRAVRYFSQYVEQIPVPVTDSKKQKPFISLVDKILTITKDDPEGKPSASNGAGDYLENTAKQAKVREYEKQIDQLVYKLYGLTAEQIKIVEQSNQS